jgi:ribosomal protein S18 acetylase RimI-like enzyme
MDQLSSNSNRLPGTPVLDNPVWYALTSTHQQYAWGNAHIKRYPAAVLPFLGCSHPAQDTLAAINGWMVPGEKLFVIGVLPALSPEWSVTAELDCVQMIATETVVLPAQEDTMVELLEEKDREALAQLVNTVQPGFFREETPLLGRYYGIKKDNRLVAVAGERLQLTGYTEVSAVCTLPGYTGRGYAQQLVAHVCNTNLQEGKQLFLHVLASNTRAIQLYEWLGFRRRRSIPVWQVGFR